MQSKSLLLIAALVGSGAAQANLLVNPGFEHPASNFLNALVPGGATWINGWTTTGTGVHWMRESLGYFTDPAGSDAVDLANYTLGNGGIRQSFATSIGTNYSVGFYGATFGNPTYGEITALIDNTVMGTYRPINPTSASNTWQYFSFNFTATDSTTTLEFRNTQAASMQYSFLDNASVVASPVPLPAGYVLMLTGLGLIGTVVRRTRG